MNNVTSTSIIGAHQACARALQVRAEVSVSLFHMLCGLSSRYWFQEGSLHRALLPVLIIDVVLQKVGSGISRAAATAHNPLHWFSGGHTHVYPRCDNDESAPVTPSAGMTASSDAGVVSMVSSVDDSALKGTPTSPGHATYGKALHNASI